ncbi:MAG: hypothetical protein IIA48_07770 [Bacteroidetes bacterium]|nr:hypothetical protein [Bacteroidota bacterium]
MKKYFILIIPLLLISCNEKIVYVDETPSFPEINFYDSANNLIADTLFVNFNQDSLGSSTFKEIFINLKVVIQFKDPDKFHKIEKIHSDKDCISGCNLLLTRGTSSRALTGLSIDTFTDSVVINEKKHFAYDPNIFKVDSLFVLQKSYYARNSDRVYGIVKHLIIKNVDSI